MGDHEGRVTIIASSTMVHHRVRCMICDGPVDHRVVFLTNDARVLHAGCVPDHVKVPTAVLLQAIRRLERMVARARATNGHTADLPTAGGRDDDPGEPGPRERDRPGPAAWTHEPHPEPDPARDPPGASA
jgi:hypothetical protein